MNNIILEKLDALAEQRKALLPLGIDAFGMPVEEVFSATEARVGNRRILFFGTNNYLGLTFDPGCLRAAHEALDKEGTGTTGSRMANGNYTGHIALEQEFADFYQYQSAILYSTGYQANLGTIAGLVGPGDVLLIDADCHASIYDGCTLSGADVVRFRHNNPADLDKRLQRLGERSRSTLIVVEGIYSMLGDQAPLVDIVEIKQQANCLLLVDEAHSLGVLGARGRGLAEAAGVLQQVDFVTGTFSKSLGSIGGYCVSDHQQLEQLRFVSRPYIFTASPSPTTIASTRVALKLLAEGVQLRESLWHNSRQLYTCLVGLGFQLGPDPGPIIAAVLDNPEQALLLWQKLLQEGIYVNLVLPPAAPDNKALVRCSVSAAHTTSQMDRICDVFTRLSKAL